MNFVQSHIFEDRFRKCSNIKLNTDMRKALTLYPVSPNTTYIFHHLYFLQCKVTILTIYIFYSVRWLYSPLKLLQCKLTIVTTYIFYSVRWLYSPPGELAPRSRTPGWRRLKGQFTISAQGQIKETVRRNRLKEQLTVLAQGQIKGATDHLSKRID